MPDHSRVAVFAAAPSFATGQALVTYKAIELLQEADFDVDVYAYAPGSIWGGAQALWFGAKIFVRCLIRPYDTIYIVNSRSLFGLFRDSIVLLSSKLSKNRLIHSHGSDVASLLLKRGYSRFARFLYRGSTVLVPSSHLLDPLCDLKNIQFKVCENFFDHSAMTQSQVQNECPVETKKNEQVVVYWNSNILASKGFFLVADSIAKLRERFPSIVFLVIGNPMGDEEADEFTVRSRLQQLSKLDWVDYRGPVTQSESIRLLEIADIVALPSRYSSECQPLAIIQAMCAGKRIIVAKTLPLRATVREYPASFSDTRDPKEFASTLGAMVEEILFDTSKGCVHTYSQAAKMARERFSVSRFRADLLTFFKKAE